MNEQERAQYMRSILQNQKTQIQQNGGTLVNPSVPNFDVQEDFGNDAEMQTNFDTGSTLASSRDKGNIFERVTNTIKSIGDNIFNGAYGFFDNLFDFSINTGMALGDWVVNNVMGGPKDSEKYAQARQNLENIRDYDWQAQAILFNDYITGDLGRYAFDKDYRNRINEGLSSGDKAREYLDWVNKESNYLSEAGGNVNNFATGIEYSIGNMLPSIALGEVVGSAAESAAGASKVGAIAKNAGKIGEIASKSGIFLGSATSSANEAYKESGKYGLSVLSGIASGLVEVGTESIPWEKFGLGKNALAGIIGQEGVTFGSKQFMKLVGQQFLQEGLEETISAIADPFIKEIYKSGTVKETFSHPAEFLFGLESGDWENSVFGQFMAGGASGGIMSSISQSTNNRDFDKKYGKETRKLLASANELGEIVQQAAKDSKNGMSAEQLRTKYQDKLGKAGTEWLEEWNKARDNMTEEQKKNLAEFLENPASKLKEDEEDYGKFIERTIKNSSDVDIALSQSKLAQGNELFNSNAQLDVLDANSIEDKEYLKQRYNLTEDEYNKIVNEEAVIKGNTILLNESMKDSYDRLMHHEYISHAILDSNEEFRNKLLSELKNNSEFMKQWQKQFTENKNAKDIIDLYDLPQELRAINVQNISEAEYKIKFAEAVESMNSEQMASFVEYILSNQSMMKTLSNLTQNRFKTILRRAIDKIKGKSNDSLYKVRQLLENTLKSIVESNSNNTIDRKQAAYGKESKDYIINKTIESNIKSRYSNFIHNNPNLKGATLVSGEYIVLCDINDGDVRVVDKVELNDLSKDETNHLISLFKKGEEYNDREFTRRIRQGFREIREFRSNNKENGVQSTKYRGQSDSRSITEDDRQRTSRGTEQGLKLSKSAKQSFKQQSKLDIQFAVEDAKSEKFYTSSGDTYIEVEGRTFDLFGHKLGYFKNATYYEIIDIESGMSLLKNGQEPRTVRNVIDNINSRQKIIYNMLENGQLDKGRDALNAFLKKENLKVEEKPKAETKAEIQAENNQAQEKYKEDYKEYKKQKKIYDAYMQLRTYGDEIYIDGERTSKLTGKVEKEHIFIKPEFYKTITSLIEQTGLKEGLYTPYLESKNAAMAKYDEIYNKNLSKLGKQKAETKASSESIDLLESHHKKVMDWLDIAKKRRIIEPVEPQKPVVEKPKVEVKEKVKVEPKAETKTETKKETKPKVKTDTKTEQKVKETKPKVDNEPKVNQKATQKVQEEIEKKTDQANVNNPVKNANTVNLPEEQKLKEEYVEWNKPTILKMNSSIEIAKNILNGYEEILSKEFGDKWKLQLKFERYDKTSKQDVYENVSIREIAKAVFDANFDIEVATDEVMEIVNKAVYVVTANKELSLSSDIKRKQIIKLKEIAPHINRNYIKDVISSMYTVKMEDSKLTKLKLRVSESDIIKDNARQNEKQLEKERKATEKVAEYEAKENAKLNEEIDKLTKEIDEAVENAKTKIKDLQFKAREGAKQLVKDIKTVDKIYDDRTRLDKDFRNVSMTKDNIENHIVSMILTPFRLLKKNSLGNSFVATDEFKAELGNLINLYTEENFNTTDVDGTDLKTSLFVEYNPALKDKLEQLYKKLPDKQEIKTADGNTEYRNQSMDSECIELISDIYRIIKETKKALDRTDSLRFTAKANAKASLDVIKPLKEDPFSKFYVGTMKEIGSSYAAQRHILSGSVLAKKLTTDMSIAESNSTLYSGNVKNDIRLKQKELKVGRQLTQKVKIKAFTSEGNIYDVQNDQLVSLYIQLKTQTNFNEINKSGLAINVNDKYRTLVAKGQAQAALDYLEENLSSELKDYANYLKQTLNGQIKTDYIEWYKSKFFVEPNELDDYWTLYRESETESHVKNMHIGVGLFKSSESRTKNNNRIVLTSATNTVISYAEALAKEMYIMPIYDDVIRMLNSRNQYGDTFKKELIRAIGQSNYDFIINNLNEMAGIKTRQYGEWLRFLQGGFALKSLSFNIGPMLKQYASVWTSNLPILKSTKGFIFRITNGFGSKAFKGELNTLINEIGSLKYRSGITTSAESNTNIISKTQKIAEVGMVGISAIDLVAMTTGLSTLMVIGEENGFKIGTQNNIDYVKEHWEEFRLSQIGRNALATNEISKGRGKLGTISQLIFGIMQGATRSATASFVNKIDHYRRNVKLNKTDLTNDLKDAKENLKNAESLLEEKRNNLSNVELNLNETGVKQQDYEKNEDYRKATQELRDAENNLINAQAEINKLESQLAEYSEYEIMGGKLIPLNVASGLIAQGIFLTLVNELMKHIRGKKDWDDWALFNEEGLVEFILNTTISWIPVLNVLVNYFVKDYNIEVASVAVLTDILDMFKNGGKLLAKATSGEATKEETSKYLREIGTGLIGFSGFNYNLFADYIIGGVRAFDPEKAIEMRNVFYGYSENYQLSTFKSYAESGKTYQATRQLNVLLNTYRVRNESSAVSKKLTELYSQGYNALPKNYMTSYTVDDITYNLSDEQIKQFRELYDKSNKVVEDMLEITSFKNKTSEEQAKIIKRIYDAYYSYAKAKILGSKADSKISQLLVLTNGNFKLTKYIQSLEIIRNITDTKRKTRKELVFEYVNRLGGFNRQEKLLLLKLAGYSSSSNNEQLVSYLRRLGIKNKEAQEWLG